MQNKMNLLLLILLITIPTVLSNPKLTFSPSIRKLLQIGNSIKSLNNPALEHIFNRVLKTELIKSNAVRERRLHPGHSKKSNGPKKSKTEMSNTTTDKYSQEVVQAWNTYMEAQKIRLVAQTKFHNSEFGIFEIKQKSNDALEMVWAEAEKKTCDKVQQITEIMRNYGKNEKKIRAEVEKNNKVRSQLDNDAKKAMYALVGIVKKAYSTRRLAAPVVKGKGTMGKNDLPDGNGDNEQTLPGSGEECAGDEKEICTAFNMMMDSEMDLINAETKFHASEFSRYENAEMCQGEAEVNFEKKKNLRDIIKAD